MKRKLSRKALMKQLHYDPATGLFWWRIRKSKRNLFVPAGSLDAKGYRSIKCGKYSYRAHRLAWLFMTGKWPSKIIDHRNMQKDNNVWTNLREATGSQNKQNGKRYRTNKSGFKGVHWDKEARKWRAQIRVNKCGKTLGRFVTPQKAAEAYCVAAKKHFGEYARVR